MGGRRPKNSANLSPEEEEKRRIRRERNKLAAARCRKRRVDHTMELEDKVQGLENDKTKLQREIQELQTVKEDLECLLQAHRTQCKLQLNTKLQFNMEFKKPRCTEYKDSLLKDIKIEVEDPTYDENDVPSPTKHLISTANNPVISAVTNPVINSTLSSASKSIRPSTLAVPFTAPPPSQIIASNKNIADIAGIQITTPSNVVAFNFDSLMEGGTGLTPVAIHPTYSYNKSPLDLATPTSEASKSLVSL